MTYDPHFPPFQRQPNGGWHPVSPDVAPAAEPLPEAAAKPAWHVTDEHIERWTVRIVIAGAILSAIGLFATVMAATWLILHAIGAM